MAEEGAKATQESADQESSANSYLLDMTRKEYS